MTSDGNIPDGFRLCTLCKETKLKSEFYGNQHKCKKCRLKEEKEKRKKNKVSVTEERRFQISLNMSRGGRKYSLDENFFETIDTEKKAYWLGFISADGSVSDSGRLRIRLANKDMVLLEKFREDIKYSGSLTSITKDCASEISIGCVKLINDLSKYYIVPRKTFTVQFPNIPKEMEHHFIRGYFDGDGCISLGKRGFKNEYYCTIGEFSILGNAKMLTEIMKRFCFLGMPERNIIYKNQNISRLRYSSLCHIQTIYEYMYKDATIFLERKKRNFEILHENRKGGIIVESDKISGSSKLQDKIEEWKESSVLERLEKSLLFLQQYGIITKNEKKLGNERIERLKKRGIFYIKKGETMKYNLSENAIEHEDNEKGKLINGI